jgi:hypothetical protein
MGVEMDDTVFINMIKTTVEKYGCTIVDVDMENHVLNLDGPDESVAECAQAIANLVGED